MSVTATLDMGLKAVETVSASLDLASNPNITHELAVGRLTLNANSTPVVSAAWSDTVALSTGAATIDLTSLSRGAVLSALDLSGLKIQAIILQAKSTNTDTISVVPGASNGFNIFGGADGKIYLAAGAACLFYVPEDWSDVAAADAEIDLASNDADAEIDVVLLAG